MPLASMDFWAKSQSYLPLERDLNSCVMPPDFHSDLSKAWNEPNFFASSADSSVALYSMHSAMSEMTSRFLYDSSSRARKSCRPMMPMPMVRYLSLCTLVIASGAAVMEMP